MTKAPEGVNWGTTNTPKEDWITPYKSYKTKSGKKVIIHNIKLFNDAGREVTYPVKGTIITKRKGKSDKHEYAIWSLDGRANVVFSDTNDLIEVEENVTKVDLSLYNN
jgi:predicted membrane GTPase involved in stress response